MQLLPKALTFSPKLGAVKMHLTSEFLHSRLGWHEQAMKLFVELWSCLAVIELERSTLHSVETILETFLVCKKSRNAEKQTRRSMKIV